MPFLTKPLIDMKIEDYNSTIHTKRDIANIDRMTTTMDTEYKGFEHMIMSAEVFYICGYVEFHCT